MFKQKKSYGTLYIPENKYETDHLQELIAQREAEKAARRRAEIRQARDTEMAEDERITNIKHTKYHVWKQSEIEYLQKNYNKMTHKNISITLGVPEQSISAKIKALGLSKKRPKCTDEEIEQIKAYYTGNSPYKSVKELAVAIGRKTGTISSKAHHLGLTEKVCRGKYDRRVKAI